MAVLTAASARSRVIPFGTFPQPTTWLLRSSVVVDLER
jgi:hypothetical protein